LSWLWWPGGSKPQATNEVGTHHDRSCDSTTTFIGMKIIGIALSRPLKRIGDKIRAQSGGVKWERWNGDMVEVQSASDQTRKC
jgi:hypothetical protein